jgi:acyl-CoA reductase-like NAD-dependent aldehyde dehydrogenase
MSKHGNGNLPHHNLYINGQWRAPNAEHYRVTTDPATGETLAMIAQADIEDTRLAIQAARDAFDDGYWANMEPGERSRLLHAVVDAIEARQDEIAEAEMRDGGCTWRKAYLLDIPVGADSLPPLRQTRRLRAAGDSAADHLPGALLQHRACASRSASAGRSSRGTSPS